MSEVLLLTVKDVARLLNMEEDDVLYLCRKHAIGYVKVKREKKFKLEHVHEYIRANEVAPCHEGTKGRVSDSSKSAVASTSSGQKTVAAVNEALVLQTCTLLKRNSRNSSANGNREQSAHVSPPNSL